MVTLTSVRSTRWLLQSAAEAAVIATLAAVAATVARGVRPSASFPLRGSAADLLEWRARAAGIEVLRIPHALQEAQRGDRIWLDVRSVPEQERRGRIPWAIPFPADDRGAVTALPALELDRPLVLYCESAACDSALREALRLRAAGFRHVSVFVEGFAGWVAAGGEIEHDSARRAP